MSHQEDCIFCKIVNKEIPAAIIYEDEETMAFVDIAQVTKGHTLLIPKSHEENIFELKASTAATLFQVAPKVANALKAAFSPLGMNLVNNNGKAASQEVFHYHLHLIPRYGEEDGFKYHWTNNSRKYSQDDLANIREQVARHLKN